MGVFFNFLWAKKLNFVHMAFFLCLIQRSKEKQNPLTNLLNSMKGQKRQNSYVHYKQCNGVLIIYKSLEARYTEDFPLRQSPLTLSLLLEDSDDGELRESFLER